MWIKSSNESKKELEIVIPLTNATGKTRIKTRSSFNEYGFPLATRQNPFTESCYVEWQIGYDVVSDDAEKLEYTTLKDVKFTGANEKEKSLYELSEYIYYFHKWGIVIKNELLDIKHFLQKLSDDDDFIDKSPCLSIERSHPIPKFFNGIEYLWTQVKYPVLVHKFDKYEIITEIVIKEKQRAVGVQPMLYFCFPVTELQVSSPLLGRAAESKESAIFVIKRENIDIFVMMLKIFGTLTENHNRDIITIIEKIIE
jgi:hypothetical protein